jgi:hypothetical protein
MAEELLLSPEKIEAHFIAFNILFERARKEGYIRDFSTYHSYEPFSKEVNRLERGKEQTQDNEHDRDGEIVERTGPKIGSTHDYRTPSNKQLQSSTGNNSTTEQARQRNVSDLHETAKDMLEFSDEESGKQVVSGSRSKRRTRSNKRRRYLGLVPCKTVTIVCQRKCPPRVRGPRILYMDDVGVKTPGLIWISYGKFIINAKEIVR